MKKSKLILKVISIFLICSFLLSFAIPIFTYASSLNDSASKLTLETIEDIEKYVDESKYPGYKEKLIALKEANPNWKFTIYFTGIEWKTAIYNEVEGLHSRSLVQGKSGEWLCKECGTKVYDLGGWMCASEKAVAYLMDIRNYLSTNYIFQFEELSYDSSLYTINGIEKVLNGTYMYNKSIREYYNNDEIEDITFSEAIMEAANISGVSPYYLAVRIRQELGVNGSDSIYGTYKGHEGYYNFYNICANSGEDPIGNGLNCAANTTLGKYLLPWNDPIKAIKGGAIWMSVNYIAQGQDTLYFQKFDVVKNGTSLYTHQYMQNIFAAKNEGYMTYLTYSRLGIIDNGYNFIIPVYENMPIALSAEPSEKTVTKEERVQVTGDSVIVRNNPGTSSNIITSLSKGTIITRLEKNIEYKNGYYWDKIKLLNGTIGYIATNYLTTNITENSTPIILNLNETLKINANNVNVRKSPSTSSGIITRLSKGTIVTRIEKNVAYKNGYYWDKIKLSNGKIGYVASKYLSTVTSIVTENSKNISTGEKVKVKYNNVNIRKSAGTVYSRIGKVSKSTSLIRLKKNVAYKNGYYWDKVKLPNGTIGYIVSKYLKKA